MDWDKVEKTEPPLTMDLNEESLLAVIAEPLKLPSYPNHTQGVERFMPVVEMACSQRVGNSARDWFILLLCKSRNLVPKFDSKKDDSKF